MEKVYVFLADGFEEVEALSPVDLLRRAGVEVCMVSVTGNLTVKGSHGISVLADALFEETDFSDADYLMLPGGMPGTKNLGAHEGLCTLLKNAQAENKGIAAICAAPSVLGDLGLLEGKEAVCYPGFESRLRGAKVSGAYAVADGSLVTGKGMGAAVLFGLKLVEVLKGKDTADELKANIQYPGDCE